MKWGRAAGVLLLLPLAARADVSVTVYNQNLGLVTLGRDFDLKAGAQHVTLSDVASQIVPASVRITFPGGVDIFEQNYHYDLVNTDAILQRYIDKTVRIIGKEGAVYEGTLLSSSGAYVISTHEGLQIVSPAEIVHVDLAELPSGFYTKPTLDWLVNVGRAGKVKADVSYLTNGISWEAEYVAHLNDADTRVDLSGWASIDNQSGAGYTDAHLKLIAGDIHRAPVPYQGERYNVAAMDMMAPEAKAGFQERSFFEYHLYDLPRRTTVANRENKQIALFEPATASVTKKYLYRSWKEADKIAVVVEFRNTEANGLGMALPAGLVRITKSDKDGSAQLLGEDRIDHTPKDENLTLEVGNAFDLVPEHTTVDRRHVSQYVDDSDVKIKLKNHKKEQVTIDVEEKTSPWQTWRVTASSLPFEKKDAGTFVFKVAVPADSEAVVTYTLRTGQ